MCRNRENKRIPGRSRKQIQKDRVNKYYYSSANFNEVDMTLQQPDGMHTTNELVATSSQQQQYDLMGAGNKGASFIFDLFKKKNC